MVCRCHDIEVDATVSEVHLYSSYLVKCSLLEKGALKSIKLIRSSRDKYVVKLKFCDAYFSVLLPCNNQSVAVVPRWQIHRMVEIAGSFHLIHMKNVQVFMK